MMKVLLKHTIFEYAIVEFFKRVSDRMNVIDTQPEKFDYDKLLEKWRPVIYAEFQTFNAVPERNIKPMLYAFEKQQQYNRFIHSGSRICGINIQELAIPLIRYVYALDVNIYSYDPMFAYTISAELISDLSCMCGGLDNVYDGIFAWALDHSKLHGVHGFLLKSDSTSASVFM